MVNVSPAAPPVQLLLVVVAIQLQCVVQGVRVVVIDLSVLHASLDFG